MVSHPAPRATAIALVLLAAPSCRGCLVDDPTYAGAGGSATTSSPATTTATTGGPGSTASTGGEGGEGGAGAAGSSSVAAGGGGAGPGSGGAPADCPRDDDFDTGIDFQPGGASCWSLMNGLDADIGFAGGAVQLQPDPGTGWYDADEGVFIHQEVTGDFTATLRVETTTTAKGEYQLAGFLLRDPGANQDDPMDENWIKSEVGKNQNDVTSDYVGVTVNGDTVIFGNTGNRIGAATLGVCRRGDDVYLASHTGGSWVIDFDGEPFTPPASAPDLPDTIQLGFNAAAYGESFVAVIDDFRFASGGGDCLTALEAL